MPRTSVIVPMFNAAATAERAVLSVLAQGDADFELIVVDDGSSDDTRSILQAFGDDRLRVMEHGANRGISAARNTALGAATGEFVAFLDADDAWEPDFLERMHAGRGEADAAICGRTVVLPDGTERTAHSHRLGRMTGDVAASCMMTGEITPFPWDKVIRRSAFSDVRYPDDLRRFEDQVVGVVALSRTSAVVSIPDPLTRYHVATGSLTWGRVPEIAETESAMTYLETSLGEWLAVGGRRDALRVCQTVAFMLTAQSAMRSSDTVAAAVIVSECRQRITMSMLASTLRRRPVFGGGALLLKTVPGLYRRLFTAYVTRKYALD